MPNVNGLRIDIVADAIPCLFRNRSCQVEFLIGLISFKETENKLEGCLCFVNEHRDGCYC